MTLNEFVEKIKFENNILFETKDIIKEITDIAQKQAVNNCACLSDEEVKNIILNYKGITEAKDLKKEIDKEVKNDHTKQNEQTSLF